MTDERLEAKTYWASLPFASYHQDGPQRRIITDAVRELGRDRPIPSVLEFGCNVGRTLHVMSKSLVPSPRVAGLDINEAALEDGRKTYGLDLRTGSEDALAKFGDDEFDCAFTVSVFDHMAERSQVRTLSFNSRASPSDTCCWLEPFDGTDRRAPATETHVQFNYYWNYPELLREMGIVLLNDLWFPLGYGTPMQPRYRLYVAAIEPTVGLSFIFTWRNRLERARWMVRNNLMVKRIWQ
jgi:SAM-dependent methyltransferase